VREVPGQEKATAQANAGTRRRDIKPSRSGRVAVSKRSRKCSINCSVGCWNYPMDDIEKSITETIGRLVQARKQREQILQEQKALRELGEDQTHVELLLKASKSTIESLKERRRVLAAQLVRRNSLKR
jgi:hypothetical protein